MEFHRRDYKNYKKGDLKRMMTSFKLFKKYGLDNCDIILIEFANANCKEVLHRREAHYIKSMRCVKKTEYNAEHKKESKKYYQDNKEYYLEQINCECGSTVTRKHLSRHIKTIKHQEFLNPIVNQVNDKCNVIKCECGIEIKKDIKRSDESTMRCHYKTKGHINFIKSKTELEI